MRIDGEWLEFADGIERPVVEAAVQAATGKWIVGRFLVDTGADRTVLEAETAGQLGFDNAVQGRLQGLEGEIDAVEIPTAVAMLSELDQVLTFRGEYAATTVPDMFRLNILGRDILQSFAVIVDYPGRIVTLVCDRHQYIIQPSIKR